MADVEIPKTIGLLHGSQEIFAVVMSGIHTHIHDFFEWAQQPLCLAGCDKVILDM
jgi:hypothetical protein